MQVDLHAEYTGAYELTTHLALYPVALVRSY